MAQFKSKNINALFVWFRLYVIKGYDGQWNIEHLKENLENAEKELRQLENKEVAHSASDNSQMDAIALCKKLLDIIACQPDFRSIVIRVKEELDAVIAQRHH